MLNFFLTTPIIEIILSDLNKIIHSPHVGGSFNFILNPETINWLAIHYSNQDRHHPMGQSHNIISLVTLFKTYGFFEPQQVFTTRGLEFNLLRITGHSFDTLSTSSTHLENLSGFQFKFFTNAKSIGSAFSTIESLQPCTEHFQNFVTLSSSNPNIEPICEMLSEKRIGFGVINQVEEVDLSKLVCKEETMAFNCSFLNRITYKS